MNSVIVRAARRKMNNYALFNWAISAHLALGPRLFAVWTRILVFVNLRHWNWHLESSFLSIRTWRN